MAVKKDGFAIVGLGVTKQGRVPDMTFMDMKVEGTRLALEDAGLKPQDLGGWVYQPGMVDSMIGFAGGDVPKILGAAPTFMWCLQAGGTSAISGIAAACAALDAGLVDYVGICYGDTALTGKVLVGAPRPGQADRSTSGTFGMYSPGACHALAARRHMAVYGTTREQLGAIALTQREYAQLRPDAYMYGRPMTMDDYLGARPIADPLGKFDYCLTADGGCAMIITTAERAKSHKKPVYISGFGFGHGVAPGYSMTQYEELGIKTAKEQTFKMAGLKLEDMDVAQLYDCFSITVLLALEDWGFCKKGEAGPFVEAGNMKLSAKIPVNTAGGELSWSYMQGFTPLCEALRQMRGESGATQVKDAEHCLVTGHGVTTPGAMGQMEYGEAGLILRRGF